MILGLQDEGLEDIKILHTNGAYFFLQRDSSECPSVILS